MAKSYPLTDEIARKNESAILRALAGVTARHVCEVSGLSESALCRLKEEKLEQYSRALAATRTLPCWRVKARSSAARTA